MTHHSDPRMIEQSIDRDRAELASTLDALQSRVSVDSLAQDALGFLRSNTASYTKSVDEAVRANPLALALVGVGLAWLMFGGRKQPEAPKAKLEAMSSWEDDGGPARPSDDHVTDWTDASDDLRRKTSAKLRKLEAEAFENAHSGRDYASERASVISEFTAGLKQSLRDGLEGLSEMAQDKIVAAREAAYSARMSVVDRLAGGSARTASQFTGRLLDDHPLVTGAVVLALGAALGSILPRSDFEDNAFGSERDRLMAKATNLLAEERAAVLKVAGDLKTDLSDTAHDAARRVADNMANTVADTVVKATETVSGGLVNAVKAS